MGVLNVETSHSSRRVVWEKRQNNAGINIRLAINQKAQLVSKEIDGSFMGRDPLVFAKPQFAVLF